MKRLQRAAASCCKSIALPVSTLSIIYHFQFYCTKKSDISSHNTQRKGFFANEILTMTQRTKITEQIMSCNIFPISYPSARPQKIGRGEEVIAYFQFYCGAKLNLKRKKDYKIMYSIQNMKKSQKKKWSRRNKIQTSLMLTHADWNKAKRISERFKNIEKEKKTHNDKSLRM